MLLATMYLFLQNVRTYLKKQIALFMLIIIYVRNYLAMGQMGKCSYLVAVFFSAWENLCTRIKTFSYRWTVVTSSDLFSWLCTNIYLGEIDKII